MPLRLRRGTNAERQTITPAQGELIYVTDTKRIWVGDGTTVGGVDIVAAGGGSLQGSINLNTYNIEGLGNIDIDGTISNGIITFNGSAISTDDTFIASGSGNTIQRLNLGNQLNFVQSQRYYGEPVEPIDLQYGITNGFFSLVNSKNVSRGTLDTPTPVFAGDCLTVNRTYGYDGFDYVLSSSIWQGVDPLESVGPGYVPGAIALITYGSGGENVAGFDSNGNFGINKFPDPATEALDVNGNGLFSGSVTAAAFKGSFFADDSTLLVDGLNGTLSNGTLTLKDGTIFSNDTFVTVPGSQTVSRVTFGSTSNSSQSVRYFHDLYEPFEKTYGLSQGFASLQSGKYSSRGTLASPTALQPSDCISVNVGYGYDGSDYILSSLIWQGVDPASSVTSGAVPGTIVFYTAGPGGLSTSSAFNSDGYFGVRNGNNPITEALDVTGNIKVTGQVKLYQDTAGGIAEEFYGVSSGPSSLLSLKYASNGTLASPTALAPGEAISGISNFGYDGTGYTLSSVIGFGIDPNGTVSAGAAPGNIVFITTDNSGALNLSSGFDSNGYLGIRNGANAATEALDVTGNGKFTGKVIVRQPVQGESTYDAYGTTLGYTALATNKYASNGTLNSPTALALNDCISFNGHYGYDGTTYQLSSVIWCGVDSNIPVSSGVVPGQIKFFTFGLSGINPSSGFDANGNLGIRNAAAPTTAALDVVGDGKFTGEVNAAAFKGTFVADDSTIVIDGIEGNVTGNTVTSNGFVMFGSYDSTGRSNLIAANGMVIYNTTANRFQGFQNGAWINLDDGTAAP